MSWCCEECSYWDRENRKRWIMRHWPLWLGLVAILALFACATPRYSDGTRAGIAGTLCTHDDCGKLPEGF